MKKMVKILPLVGALMLSGCADYKTSELFHYTVDVPQGNYIEYEKFEQLTLGMSLEQVIYLLGTPVLQDRGDGNSFTYVFLDRKGTHNAKEQVVRVHFDPQTKLLSEIETVFSHK